MTDKVRQDKTAATIGLTRLSRRWLIVMLVIIAALSAVTGLFAGRILNQSEIVRPGDSFAEIPVYAAVESRVVDDRLTFSGVINAGPSMPLQIDSEGSEPMVVRQTLKVGTTAKWGDLAGVVSGKPYFLLPGPLPLYRDLFPGDEGDDVLALQRALSQVGYFSTESGRVDSATIEAASFLFASEGFTLRSGRTISSNGRQAEPGATPTAEAPKAPALSIPFRQLIALPVASAKVDTALGVGQKVTDESPLAKFQMEDNFVEFIAEVQQVQSLKTGQEVTVRVMEKQLTGRITGIAPFREAGDGRRAGHLVTVVPANKADLGLLTPNLSVTVAGQGTAEEALAVPLSAIRQDADGTYVLRSSGGNGSSKESTTRIPVTVFRSGGGFAAVTGELAVGDEVQIS